MEAAFKLKKEARKYIADAKFDTELYKGGTDEETGMEDLVPAGKLADYNMQFKALMGYDIMKTGYKYNFTKLRDSVYKAVKEGYKAIDKGNLNEYYLQIVDAGYAKSLSAIKKSKNVLELAKADAASMNLPLGTDLELKGIRNIKDYDAVYTNNDIKVIKRILKRQLDSYVNGQLKMSGYKEDVKELKKSLKDYKKDIDKTLYVGMMFTKTENYINKMVKKTGIEYDKISVRDMNKAREAVDKVLSNFNDKDYSSKGWKKIENAYNDTNDAISSTWYKGELYGLDKQLKKKLDKVKTIKEEKAEKAKKKAETGNTKPSTKIEKSNNKSSK